ncbi:MAG: hypothetical protein K6E84_07215, partial [Lachnospiraceae bacterium]|nr:hypothetical protein [Lachnospiraceae bacterium]
MKKYFSDKINHKAKGKKGARVLALLLSFVLAATPQLGAVNAWAEPAPADAPQASSEPDLEVPVVYDSLTGEVVEQSGGYIPSAADYNTPVANEDLTPQKAESMIAPGFEDEEELSAEKAWEDA